MASHTRHRRTSRPIATWAGNVGLVLVVLLAVAYVLPSLLGYERYVLTGGSMTGTYDKGSLVFEKAVASDDLEVGDVITYLPPSDTGVTTLVTHRISKIGKDELGRRVLQTQGDANPDPDPWKFTLTDSQQPVVEFAVPYVGYALIALADRETRMLVVGLPALIIALASLGELAGALRSRPQADAGGVALHTSS